MNVTTGKGHIFPPVMVVGLFPPPFIDFEGDVPEACCEYVRKKVLFETLAGCGGGFVLPQSVLRLVCRRACEVLLDLVKKGYLFRSADDRWSFCDPTATWRHR